MENLHVLLALRLARRDVSVGSWVKNAVLTVILPLPVYPEQRKSSDRRSWSGWCHEETSDELVGAAEQTERNLFRESLRCLNG
jgi:hypothetical protein